jgi:rhodanese-related sulfurtransferase
MSHEKIGASDLREHAKHVTVIDIRKEPDDRQIPGSLRYDGAALEDADALPFTEQDEVVLYCGSGNSCSRVAATLRERGYNTVALEGGYRAWKESGFDTEPISEKRTLP